jgi:hypothetical protein
VGWERVVEREQTRYADGIDRLDPEQLVRVGNAAYGAGLALLMLGRNAEARCWLRRAATRWRESFEYATPTSWGRPIGALKAALLAGDDEAAARHARWALGLGSNEAVSPVGRYAATLALLVLGEWSAAAERASTLRGAEGFPAPVAEALGAIAAGDAEACARAIAGVLVSFETRESYLEDVAVADTVIVLAMLAGRRGIGLALPASPLLPP